MSLFISTTSPSPEYKDSNLEKAITAMAIKLTQERKLGYLPAGPVLDVNFLVSDKDNKPAFTGMRMGNYSAGEKTLYFEREVPSEILHSNNADVFIRAVLQDVVTNAADYFEEFKVEFDLLSWKRVLKHLN